MNLICLHPMLTPPLGSTDSASEAVRRLLGILWRIHADFDAFLLDHFRPVYDCMSSGMNRVEKTNLLLGMYGPEGVLTTLHRVYPERVDWTWPPLPQHRGLGREVRLVCLYAPADAPAYREVEKGLSSLRRQGSVELWSPANIPGGRPVGEQADWAINRADLVVTLLSADFFTAPDCVRLLARCLQRQRQQAPLVIPLLAGPVADAKLRESQLAAIPMLPSSQCPLSEPGQREAGWAETIQRLREVISQRRPQRPDSAFPAIPKVDPGPGPTKPTPPTPPTTPPPSPPPPPPYVSIRLPGDLVAAARSGRLLPMAGSEISGLVRDAMPGGAPDGRLFPTWRQLLEEAASRLDDQLAAPEATLVRSFLMQRPPNFSYAVETAQQALQGLWPRLLQERLLPASSRAVPESLDLVRSLWELGSPLVVTTSYDRALRWACPRPVDLRLWDIDQVKTEELAMGVSEPTLWYLHGSAETTNLGLALDGYRRPQAGLEQDLARYQRAREALRSLLPTKTCLLVGLRFDDVSTGDPTHWLTEIFTGSRGPHYVMVRKSEGTLARAALKHLPLTLIEYPDDERALLDGLQRLSRERAR